jgi:proteasome lid subunit RPN8/RPN11
MSFKIYKSVLESIMEFSKSFYPNEFSAFLYIDSKNIINDIYIIPATVSSSNSAVIRLDLAPMNLSISGSVHSHPSGTGMPSFADLNFFTRKIINIITYYPFCLTCFKAYTQNGELTNLEII